MPVEISMAHPAHIAADVLCYPNTSFGYLTTSVLGRMLVTTGGPRVEQSIVGKRPLRMGSAVVGHPGRLPYRYLIHYVLYPGFDRRWHPVMAEQALRSAVKLAHIADAKAGVMMLPVHPPVDPRLWPAICAVTYRTLKDDAIDWTVLIGNSQVLAVWENTVTTVAEATSIPLEEDVDASGLEEAVMIEPPKPVLKPAAKAKKADAPRESKTIGRPKKHVG